MAGPGFARPWAQPAGRSRKRGGIASVPLLEAPAGISQEAVWALESVPAGQVVGV